MVERYFVMTMKLDKRLLFAVIAIVVLIAALAATPVFAQSGPPGLERAILAQEANTNRLLAQVGVHGTGVTVINGQAVVLIYADSRAVGLPARLDGVGVKVVQSDMFVAQTDPKARQPRPVPIGVSTGHLNVTAGTIGARVIDETRNVFALSNNHVYADGNDASKGDFVIQPGTLDGGHRLR